MSSERHGGYGAQSARLLLPAPEAGDRAVGLCSSAAEGRISFAIHFGFPAGAIATGEVVDASGRGSGSLPSRGQVVQSTGEKCEPRHTIARNLNMALTCSNFTKTSHTEA